MSKTHTPGPWIKTRGFISAEKGAICKMSHDSPIQYAATPGSKEDEANARAIEAIPELMADLKSDIRYLFRRVVDWNNPLDVEQLERKRALLSRIEGGE